MTGRRETERMEMGCKETGRKETGRKETGGKTTGGKTTGVKPIGVRETGGRREGRYQEGRWWSDCLGPKLEAITERVENIVGSGKGGSVLVHIGTHNVAIVRKYRQFVRTLKQMRV